VSIEDAASRRTVFEDSKEERWLVWIDPTGDGKAEILRRDIPGDVRAIDAIDRDGDGNDDIAFWRPGGIWTVRSGLGMRPDGPLEPLVADDRPRPGANAARALCAPIAWTTAALDRDRRLPARVRSGPGRIVGARLDIPFRSAWTSPRDVHAAKPRRERAAAGTGGTPDLRHRTRGHGRRPSAHASRGSVPAARNAAVECWSRLPGPEKLIESRYLWIGGKPALVVTTRSA
jgi:hypothetical protein